MKIETSISVQLRERIVEHEGTLYLFRDLWSEGHLVAVQYASAFPDGSISWRICPEGCGFSQIKPLWGPARPAQAASPVV